MSSVVADARIQDHRHKRSRMDDRMMRNKALWETKRQRWK